MPGNMYYFVVEAFAPQGQISPWESPACSCEIDPKHALDFIANLNCYASTANTCVPGRIYQVCKDCWRV